MGATGSISDATVAQIAAHCSVSPVTVSRALRGHPAVAESTRNRILLAAEMIGYRPRVRMGRPRRTDQNTRRPAIEVILGVRFNTTFYSVLLTIIEYELAARRHDCIIRSANGEYKHFMQLCEVLRESPETPTLLIGYLPVQQVRTLLEARPHVLLVDHNGDPALEAPYASVGFDNTEAARMMVRHLCSKGRRRILLVNGLAEHYFSREIALGYREALTQLEQPIDPDLILETDFTPEAAVDKLTDALDKGLSFDAVFSTDEMAIAILHSLLKRNIRVPDDVAIGGCDGLPFGAYLTPPLTTVLLDHVQLGRLAVERILDPAFATASPARTRLLPRLLARASTGN